MGLFIELTTGAFLVLFRLMPVCVCGKGELNEQLMISNYLFLYANKMAIFVANVRQVLLV